MNGGSYIFWQYLIFLLTKLQKLIINIIKNLIKYRIVPMGAYADMDTSFIPIISIIAVTIRLEEDLGIRLFFRADGN